MELIIVSIEEWRSVSKSCSNSRLHSLCLTTFLEGPLLFSLAFVVKHFDFLGLISFALFVANFSSMPVFLESVELWDFGSLPLAMMSWRTSITELSAGAIVFGLSEIGFFLSVRFLSRNFRCLFGLAIGACTSLLSGELNSACIFNRKH